MSERVAVAPRPAPSRDDGADRGGLRAFFAARDNRPYVLLPAIPLAVALELAHAPAAAIFIASAIGVIPTAAAMGRATEELADRAGPGIGGLLNVTFGNFPELIIAFFALIAGLHEVVKASIIGSVISNILLVMGASMLVGGWRRDHQYFSRRAAGAQGTMLLLATSALVMPAVFELVDGGGLPSPGEELVPGDELADGARLPGPDDERARSAAPVEQLSLGVAIVLLFAYVGGLWFSLKSHRDVFNPPEERDEDAEEGRGWSVRKAVIVLAVAGLAVGLMSEMLVGTIDETATSLGLSEFFIGVIVVAIVGNAAEHWVAVWVAAKDKMDLAVNIAIGSSAQVALFVAPVLVLLSFFFGPRPMPLVFNGFELGGVFLAVTIGLHVVRDGESTWFEGLLLVAVYIVLGMAFFFA